MSKNHQYPELFTRNWYFTEAIQMGFFLVAMWIVGCITSTVDLMRVFAIRLIVGIPVQEGIRWYRRYRAEKFDV